MNPAHSPRSPFRFAAFWAGAALALAACEDRVAGTSVGTGNPTEIEVAFKDSTGAPVALTGSLQVYAATQIPVPGFRPQPLVSLEVSASTTASLKAEDLAGLPDSAWAPGSAKDGIYDFNLVVSGQTQGAILKGYSFRKSSARFLLGDESVDGTGSGGLATVEGKVAPLTDIHCSLEQFSSTKDNYLFISGTGFAAKDSSGHILFKGIPNGRHDVLYVVVPRKDSSSSWLGDSLLVYGVSQGIQGGADNTVRLDGNRFMVPVPEGLKPAP